MALDLACPSCKTDEHVVLVEWLTGTQRRLRCEQCDAVWLLGEPAAVRALLPTLADIKRRFPTPDDIPTDRLARAAELKAVFLAREPEPEPNVAPFWAKYQQIFSAEGLPTCDPQDLNDFANSNVGANPGNMSVFNDEWNSIGPTAGAERVRDVIDDLLRGTRPAHLEDCLTGLIHDTKSTGMKGFKESLLTKVLCVAYPDRYLTILKYTGEAGKREIARSIWGFRASRSGEGQLDHRPPHPLEQRPFASTTRRGLQTPAACCGVSLVGEGSSLSRGVAVARRSLRASTPATGGRRFSDRLLRTFHRSLRDSRR